MYIKPLVFVFFFISRFGFASPEINIINELKQRHENNLEEKDKDQGIQNLDLCYSCYNNNSVESFCCSNTRFCYLCNRFFCKKYCTNDFAKVSTNGGIICDHCFLDIGGVFDDRIDKICRLTELLKIYEKLFLVNHLLTQQLRNDAELVNSQKFKESIKEATGNSLGVISSLLLISSRIALLAVPGCQVISIISLCSLASGISSNVVKEGGSLAFDKLQIESLTNMNLIATLFLVNQIINLQLESEFKTKKNQSQGEMIKEIFSNPILNHSSEENEEEHSSIKTAKKIAFIAIKSVFGFVGLADSSFGLYNNSKEIISGDESDLSQLFVKIAEELEKLEAPCYFREKIKMISK